MSRAELMFFFRIPFLSLTDMAFTCMSDPVYYVVNSC
jgi:hypothetical protein